MKVHCTNCGCNIHISFSYCPYCGSTGTQKTIPSGIKKEEIAKGYFCHSCKEKNYEDALYCAYCGIHLYSKSGKQEIFCPECGEKSPSQSKFCLICGLSLTEWFQMKGKIAEISGYAGNFAIQDKYTGIIYEFVKNDIVTIGRHSSNTISISCNLVSKRHCAFNIKENKLRDLDSTNGTYINREAQRISTAHFDNIEELNIAGTFTFEVTQTPGFFAVKLKEILDDRDCKDCNHAELGETFHKHYYILLLDDGDLRILKKNGSIVTEINPGDDYVTISMDAKRYYFTDPGNGIIKHLIRKSYNPLPSNLKVIFPTG